MATDLSQRALQSLLRLRPDLLHRHHFTVLCSAAQHNAGAASANEFIRRKVLRQDEAVLWGEQGGGGVNCMKDRLMGASGCILK